MLGITIAVTSASKEAQRKRNRNAGYARRFREGKRRTEKELLDLLELRVVNYLKYGGTFAPEKAPRRCDYIGKDLKVISYQLTEVERRLKIKIIEELRSRNYTPMNGNELDDYELDVLERKLLECLGRRTSPHQTRIWGVTGRSMACNSSTWAEDLLAGRQRSLKK
ncbi:hypothetical protein BDV09DRAFT_200889 [Aspergillus tetrazonus]